MRVWRGAVVMIALVVAPTACSASSGASACEPAISEPVDQNLGHVLAGAPEPTYRTDPPTSGPHAPGAVPSGAVAAPLRRPDQVGVLEAGGVLVQYRDLRPSELDELKGLVADRVIVAPNPDLPSRVVATAWLAKQTCSDVDPVALRRFVRTHIGKGPG